MSSFAQKRWTGILLVSLLIVVVSVSLALYRDRFYYLPHLSGWLLMILMLVLTLFNGRKKLPFLPAGTSRGWLQFHVYVGWFTVFLFVVHLRGRFPTGWFEGILAFLFVLVAASGVLGIFLSRSLSRRLTTRGGEVIYEKIPTLRRALEEQAEALSMKSIAVSRTSTIADFYVQHLQAFFRGPKNFLHHFFEVRRPLQLLMDELKDVERYLDAQEKETILKLGQLVRQKDDLDYHHSLQTMLKVWLFVHIPFTYSLLLFSAVHILLVYGFSGGAR